MSHSLVVLVLLLSFCGCRNNTVEYYTVSDLTQVPKIDSHFHYNTPDIRYLQFADANHFKLVSVNVDAGMSLDSQLMITSQTKQRYQEKFAFVGTFPVNDFGKVNFAALTIARIHACMKAGASGIKIWKNIGMSLKDSLGRYVMADDQAFNPVFKFLEANKIPVLAHLGEPRNCWLPLGKMTLGNDYRYFKEHPQYHMYLHPDAPSYEDQINARDHLPERYPGLNFTGAHLASLEWNVDSLANRFDRFPNLQADLADRIGHLQYQSLSDYDKVRNFLIKYQDRLMYATDVTINKTDTNYQEITARLSGLWKDHWIFLATDSVMAVNDLDNKKVKGVKLPSVVIDKIYFRNAEHFFNNSIYGQP
jgi:hypothetical protein